MDCFTGDISVLSSEREHDYDNEVCLSKFEEEMVSNFGDDHQPLEFKELSGSVVWDSGFADDSAGKASLTGDHSVLSGEREHDCGNVVILSKVEEEMWPNFGDDHQPLEFKELSGSVVWDSGFADDSAGKASLTGDHSVLSGEREHDCGNVVILSKVEEEMWPNFGDDHQPLELEELLGSVTWDSGFIEDSQKNAAVVNEEEVIQSPEHGSQLSELEKLDSPTPLSLHVDLGKIVDEKHPSHEKREIPEDQDRKIARIHVMVMLSPSMPFLIAATLLLGIFLRRRSSSNTCQPQATEELYKGQPIVHSSSSAELQSPTAPHASTSTDSAFYQKHNPVPCVELLGEITFGEPNRSQESITVTKSQLNKQSSSLISPEKKLVHKGLWESTFTIESPIDGSTLRKQEATPSHKCRLFHCNCSIGNSKISIDRGINGLSLATPSPLRRSSRIRNRAVQSP
ncbi:hypothetical protein MLD38_007914 [Melastoma candidum]|nr:hypothetical protein MLD38_007914 [Melastoma candidum]